ncbi:MAG: aspartate ammonia-lyase [Oscillospiraceae bacterium]|nr:aspartate ammonia-lyase [Oscillospiraceae bacterium]
MRTETDELGTRELPDDALYGLQTLRARENFALGGEAMPLDIVRAMAQIKLAAARAHLAVGVERREVFQAISNACEQVIAGACGDAFFTPALQGGAGTSAHMNVNEVIANLALQSLGKPCGRYDIVHPLDDVNRGQSTNDVFPTAIRIAAILRLRDCSEAFARLQNSLQQKENAFGDIQKCGRTEWMDAVPITLGSAFGAFAQAVGRDRWRLYKMEERLRQINLGGTAVGNGDNASRLFRHRVVEELRRIADIGLAAAEYPMDITQNADVFAEASGLLKAAAVNWMKICGDLRRMQSGPHAGLGEITLAPLQKGSTIMPGKYNPVIPEMAMQIAMQVIANDTAITLAASNGEFELNAFMPLIAARLLQSLRLMTNGAELLREKCVDSIEANPARCAALLEESTAFATRYTPALGYDTVARLVQTHATDASALAQDLRQALAAKTAENEAR